MVLKRGQKVVLLATFWVPFFDPLILCVNGLSPMFMAKKGTQKWVEKWVKSDILDHFWVPLFSGSNRGVYFGII